MSFVLLAGSKLRQSASKT